MTTAIETQTFAPLTYIQRFKHRHGDKVRNEEATISRFLSKDYMGSAEFEFGSVPRALKWLRDCDLTIKDVDVTHNGKTVRFWVISDQTGVERFKQRIEDAISGKTYSKEWNGLYELFSDLRWKREVDMWLDVTATVNRDTDSEHAHPVFFTNQKYLATRAFLELYRTKIISDQKDDFNVQMFDHVYIPNNFYPGKLAGINADGTYTVKVVKSRFTQSGYDVWPVELFPLEALNNASLCFRDYRNMGYFNRKKEND